MLSPTSSSSPCSLTSLTIVCLLSCVFRFDIIKHN
ncbi:Uncharacterised protein [Vibrio cholerae]|nr:Uncharacterised protein [Vibrio cholerae]